VFNTFIDFNTQLSLCVEILVIYKTISYSKTAINIDHLQQLISTYYVLIIILQTWSWSSS